MLHSAATSSTIMAHTSQKRRGSGPPTALPPAIAGAGSAMRWATSAVTAQTIAPSQNTPRQVMAVPASRPMTTGARAVAALAATLASVTAVARLAPCRSASVAGIMLSRYVPKRPITSAPPMVTTGVRPVTSRSAPAAIPPPPPQKTAGRPRRAARAAPVTPARIMPTAIALMCSPARV